MGITIQDDAPGRRILNSQLLAYTIIGAAALWVGFAGLRWGTLSAGSADSYGYVSQAALWLRGDLVIRQPIAQTMPWTEADWTFAPIGYRPGVEAGTIVPIYPAGLPLVMAVLLWLGGPQAVYLAVPLLGAALVMAAAALAYRMSGPGASIVTTVLLASSPTLLFSVMWPMSDVPAAAWWSIALLLVTGNGIGAAIGAGLAAAIAILTRPNLVALAIAPALYLAWRVSRPDEMRRDALGRLLIFCALTAVGSFAVAGINMWLYGSPLQSGHGAPQELFSVSNVPEAVSGFAFRPLELEPALVLLGVAGLIAHLRQRNGASSIAWLCGGLIALVLLSYSSYKPFVEWWYLRLLLSGFSAAAVLGGAGAIGIMRLMPSRWQAPFLVVLCVAIAGYGLTSAVERGVFQLRSPEARYAAIARFVSRALPRNAVFFAYQQSGGLHQYAGRITLRFDTLLPKWFDTAISKMRSRGYRPYFVVEDGEMDVFKARFRPVSPLGYLDWPPMAEMQRPVRVRIWDPADRGRFREGQEIVTHKIEP